MSSILTNSSSMVALQTLKGINKGMAKVQDEISTGLKVATAKDNSSSWSIASTMNSDVSSFKKLGESLTSASAMVGTARTAAEQIGDLVKQIQTKVVQAQNPDADLTKLGDDIAVLADTITSIAASSQYNGINLVNAAYDATDATTIAATSANITVSVTRSAAGAVSAESFRVQWVDLGAAGDSLKVLAGLTNRDAATGTYADYDAETLPTAADLGGIGTAEALAYVDSVLDAVNSAAATFGSAQSRIEAQNAFLSKQADALKNGVGAMVDADMEEASARLAALQTQQQLGIQALSIANQAPQNVLSLFR
ncbi:flagellin [Amaricoccus sp.]|uniref:flagellin N-terminal helical domain-containing protein n=1 Tax=Amaricoccus sp. TaxID=1872485 RepID=UPI0026113DE6|nr:flagellin [Amaricoccus sp.]HRO11251.1 flagellin [Amaricoccus sp.]